MPHPAAHPKRATERARLAGIVSTCGADSPRAQAAQRDYRAVALQDHIESVLATAPPLTTQQRAKLAALLRPSTVDVEAVA